MPGSTAWLLTGRRVRGGSFFYEMAVYYTTVPLMERYLSPFGVEAFADHDNDGVADDDVIDDVLGETTRMITNILCPRYDSEQLTGNDSITDIATVIACRLLCLRRGNPPPDSLEMRYQELMKYLEALASGAQKICGLRSKPGGTPVWSNLTVIRGYGDTKHRVIRGSSSTNQSALPRRTAPSQEQTYGR